MTEERPKAPSQMKIEEWKTGNKLYEMALKDHTWEKYLKSIGKTCSNCTYIRKTKEFWCKCTGKYVKQDGTCCKWEKEINEKV